MKKQPQDDHLGIDLNEWKDAIQQYAKVEIPPGAIPGSQLCEMLGYANSQSWGYRNRVRKMMSSGLISRVGVNGGYHYILNKKP